MYRKAVGKQQTEKGRRETHVRRGKPGSRRGRRNHHKRIWTGYCTRWRRLFHRQREKLGSRRKIRRQRLTEHKRPRQQGA